MKKIITLYLFVVVQADKTPEKYCDGAPNHTENPCYYKETLLSISHSANQIAVDKYDRLYFSYDTGQGVYVPVRVKMGTDDLKVIGGIKDAFAMTADRKSGLIYFGGSHGIYKFNPEFMSLKKLAANNLDIWWLVIKESIYFLKFPSLIAYRYSNRTIRMVPELKMHAVNQFLFDMDDNIFFINNTGLYGILNGTSEVVALRAYTRFVGMTTDITGHVYVCGEDGIYIVSKMVSKVKKVLNIPGVLGMTFDKNNNLIYTNSHDIVRLTTVPRS